MLKACGHKPDLRAQLSGLQYLVFGRIATERRFIADLVKSIGARQLAEAANLQDANFESIVRSPDIIIWVSPDNELSDVAGFLQLIRTRGGRRPAITLVCEACSEQFLRRMLQLGLNSIVIKPFSAHRLASNIARAAWQQSREYHLD